MEKISPNYGAILQNLVDRFVHLQSLLKPIATESAQLMRWQRDWKF